MFGGSGEKAEEEGSRGRQAGWRICVETECGDGGGAAGDTAGRRSVRANGDPGYPGERVADSSGTRGRSAVTQRHLEKEVAS